VVELRYFGGFGHEDIAATLSEGRSPCS